MFSLSGAYAHAVFIAASLSLNFAKLLSRLRLSLPVVTLIIFFGSFPKVK